MVGVGIYHNQSADDREYVEARIKNRPAFSNVTIRNRTDGGVLLYGTVATNEDFDDLTKEVTMAIGERRAKEALVTLHVGSPTEPDK